MATASYPPGQTFFSTLKRSFADVSIDESNDNHISTSEFLEACESLIDLLNLLGKGLSMATTDIANNVKKVRTRQLQAPAASESIQELVKNEVGEGKKTATEGLLWLLRGLDFTSTSIASNLKNPDKELSDGFQEGYKVTLQQHHSFLVKKGVLLLLSSAVPYRKDFYAKLGSDQAQIDAEQKVWVEAFQKIVAILQSFMSSPLVMNALGLKK